MIPGLKAIGVGWDQPVPDDADWPELEEWFAKCFSGAELNEFICGYSRLREFLYAERLLVKFVRAKLMLPWLIRTFAFRHKPIMMTRHPIAVALSASKHKWFKKEGGAFPMPEHYPGYYLEHEDILQSLETPEEYFVARWCLTNKYLLEHPDHRQKWCVLHYEHLLLAPQESVEHIFSEWGMAMPDRISERFDRASRTNIEGDFRSSRLEQLDKWKDGYDQQTIGRFRRIMDHFEIDLYDGSSMPRRDSAALGHMPVSI
ncbi:hypothetical protein [Pseudoroseicyclus tamaricis]|uniref:hypothetical protein n=1 Tax=Pseudoroseicyclus tamaricis TaxID=2705421 RepID=UPI001432F2B9|nr:hypothetical protein [Pseudoroseicyclus tamaricis]